MTSDRPTVSTSSRDPEEVRWYSISMFGGHLGLLAVACASLWLILGGGWPAIGLMACAVVVYFVLWRTWLAPVATRRLRYRERLTVHLVLGPAIAVLASLADLWLPALIAVSVIVLSDALDERSRSAR
ncbi:MAG: hypothetical protein ACK5KO_04340 [Arachnia sp.]